MVQLQEKSREIEYICHLMIVKPVSIEEVTEESASELPKMYFRVLPINLNISFVYPVSLKHRYFFFPGT